MAAAVFMMLSVFCPRSCGRIREGQSGCRAAASSARVEIADFRPKRSRRARDRLRDGYRFDSGHYHFDGLLVRDTQDARFMTARLMAVAGPLEGATFPLPEGDFTIAYDTDNALCV